MIICVSIFFFAAIFFALSDIVIRFRQTPLSGALCVTFALFIALESLILNGLSLFNAVNRTCLILANILFLCVWFGWTMLAGKSRIKIHLHRYKYLIKSFWANFPYRLLLPIIILVALTAWLYPPNNYDSMTYHMARVAHWIQNGSVEYYQTAIDRQNEMGPGAEYVILFFQILTCSDVLANSVQLFSFLILIFSSGYLLNILGISRRISPYIVILGITAPMAVMQASSTKNDLVAAVMTLAVIVSIRRLFCGKIQRLNIYDFMMIGICMGSGFLVKPISLVVSAPLIMISLLYQQKHLVSSRHILKKNLIGIMAVFLIAGVVAGPDMLRKELHNVSRVEVYPLFSEWDKGRLWNPVRTLGQNTPFPDETRKLLKWIGYPGNLTTQNVFHAHEDLVGNPFQVMSLFVLAFLTITLSPFAILRPEYWRSLLLSLFPVAAWILFSLIIRDQIWITRLQLPLIFLLPFSFLFIVQIVNSKKIIRRAFGATVSFIAFFSLAYGTLAATHIPSRPLVLSHFWGERLNRIGAYYNNVPIKAAHDHLLSTAKNLHCNRIGLMIGPDSCDYPLTWRAMLSGMTTRHFWNAEKSGGKTRYIISPEASDWPCLLYVASGSVEHVPNRGSQWVAIGDDGHTFCRNLEYEFHQSKQTCLLIESKSMFKKIKPMHEIAIHTAPEGVMLRSSGNDPYILLPEISCGGFHHSVVLKVEMRSPVKTTLQLFYRTSTQDQFNEEQSMKKCIRQGDNIVYFQLPINEMEGSIRMDPGTAPGEYVLYSLEARTIVPYTNDRNPAVTTAENQ